MYQVQLREFEGPLDLLLFFIKRDELNIYDIPIAKVTDQFLDYIHLMEEMDLTVASEFIWMASLLMSIKVKMMLPRENAETEELDETDPRFELVQALLEYKRYKEMSAEFRALDHKARETYFRGSFEADRTEVVNDGEVLKNVTIVDLMAAIKHVLRKVEEAPVHKIEKVKTNIEQQTEYLKKRLKGAGKMSFLSICMELKDRGFIVVTFLAALEMIRSQWLELFLGDHPTDFLVEYKSDAVAVM